MTDFRSLIRIPELMSHIVSYINVTSMLVIFSAKQLEYFWEFLSEDTKKQFGYTLFIGQVNLSQTMITYWYNSHFQLETLSTYFHFFNKNWKFFLLPYVKRLPSGEWTLTLCNRDIMTTQTRLEMRRYVTRRVYNYFQQGLCRMADIGKTSEESILFARFMLSIRDIIGPNAFQAVRRCMGPTLTMIEISLSSVYDNPTVFNDRIELLKAFNYHLRYGEHPVYYCRKYYPTRQHISLMLDYVKSIPQEDGVKKFNSPIEVLCWHVMRRSEPVDHDDFSEYMWNWGCRCYNHVKYVNQIISTRYPMPERTTHDALFERQKKLAKFCKKIADMGKMVVSVEICRTLFRNGCRCSNHSACLSESD